MEQYLTSNGNNQKFQLFPFYSPDYSPYSKGNNQGNNWIIPLKKILQNQCSRSPLGCGGKPPLGGFPLPRIAAEGSEQ